MDTVRADHLSCYGYAVATSPNIDALARRATRYTRAFSTAPWTLPAHASLFTGLFPFEHGAHTFEVSQRADSNVYPLHAAHQTLAEFLHDRGYCTAAVSANAAFTRKGYGLDQGFEVYDVKRWPAAAVNKRAFELLDSAGSRPFFLFVNYMDAHRPYHAVERPGLLTRRVTPDPKGERLDELLDQIAGGDEVDVALRQEVIDRYDTGIAHADEAVGELLRKVESMGRADSTIVLITSDHGEFFGEHGLIEHSKDLYAPVLHVPLIVSIPGRTPAEVNDVISLADVPRMIVDALPGMDQAAAERAFPHSPGSHPVIAENYFSRMKDLFDSPWGLRFHRVRRSIVEGDLQYIHSSDGKHELYDWQADRACQNDLMARRPADAARLAQRLEAFMRERPACSLERQPVPLTASDRGTMGELGYLQNGDGPRAATQRSSSGSRPSVPRRDRRASGRK